jgi:hypothetical protein
MSSTQRTTLTSPQGPTAAATLTVHIGLPKTATTFLQTRVFQSEDNLAYVYQPKRVPLQKALERLQRLGKSHLGEILGEISKELPQGNVLVSDENISMHVGEPWHYKGPTPESFGKRFELLKDIVPRLKIILGIRRQDQWLASRYAESARMYEAFCQEDFDKRVLELCNDNVKGALRWLDYSEAWKRLSACVGQENVLLLPMEEVGSNPEGAIQALQNFRGVDGWMKRYRDNAKKIQPRNVLSVGENEWNLKGHDTTLRLKGELQVRILERYRSSNQQLSELCSLNLDRHGYC